MTYYNYGSIVRSRREALGLTQEALALGICSSATLSRIENGTQLPTRSHYDHLSQRLCLPSGITLFAADNNIVNYINLKEKMKHLLYSDHLEKLPALWNSFESLTHSVPTDSLDRQFIDTFFTITHRQSISTEERLQRYINALRITCPYYKNLLPSVISFDEAIDIIAILLCKYQTKEEAVLPQLIKLLNYFENDLFDFNSSIHIRLMLAGIVGEICLADKSYDYCLEVCEHYIGVAKENGGYRQICKLLKIQSLAYERRNRVGDFVKSLDSKFKAIQLENIIS